MIAGLLPSGKRTFINSIFVLLALPASTSHAVQFVHEAAAAAAARCGLLLVLSILVRIVVIVAAKLVDVVHCFGVCLYERELVTEDLMKDRITGRDADGEERSGYWEERDI